ncbi:protein phosphatase 2A regulatory subunit cdc55, partial [Conglomerata obtusa]
MCGSYEVDTGSCGMNAGVDDSSIGLSNFGDEDEYINLDANDKTNGELLINDVMHIKNGFAENFIIQNDDKNNAKVFLKTDVNHKEELFQVQCMNDQNDKMNYNSFYDTSYNIVCDKNLETHNASLDEIRNSNSKVDNTIKDTEMHDLSLDASVKHFVTNKDVEMHNKFFSASINDNNSFTKNKSASKNNSILKNALNRPFQNSYQTKYAYKSHTPEFDYLESTDISEKIVSIEMINTGDSFLNILCANEKTIKFWNIRESSSEDEYNEDTISIVEISSDYSKKICKNSRAKSYIQDVSTNESIFFDSNCFEDFSHKNNNVTINNLINDEYNLLDEYLDGIGNEHCDTEPLIGTSDHKFKNCDVFDTCCTNEKHNIHFTQTTNKHTITIEHTNCINELKSVDNNNLHKNFENSDKANYTDNNMTNICYNNENDLSYNNNNKDRNTYIENTKENVDKIIIENNKKFFSLDFNTSEIITDKEILKDKIVNSSESHNDKTFINNSTQFINISKSESEKNFIDTVNNNEINNSKIINNKSNKIINNKTNNINNIKIINNKSINNKTNFSKTDSNKTSHFNTNKINTTKIKHFHKGSKNNLYKIYENAHQYSLNDIKNLPHTVSFLSSDYLRINLWDINYNQPQLLIDIKPEKYDDLDFVITNTHCLSNFTFLYSTSKGEVYHQDLRISPKSHNYLITKNENSNDDPLVSICEIQIIDNILATRDLKGINLYDTRTNKLIKSFKLLEKEIIDVIQSKALYERIGMRRSGDLLVTGGFDKKLYLIDVKRFEKKEIIVNDEFVKDVEFYDGL